MVSLSCSVDQDFSWSGRRMHRATVSQKNTAAWTVFSSLPAFSRRVPRCPGFISSMRRIYPDKRYPCVFQKSGIFGQNPQFHNQESIGKIIISFVLGFLPMGKKKKKNKKKNLTMFSNSNTNIANNNTVKKYDLDRRQFLSKCRPIRTTHHVAMNAPVCSSLKYHFWDCG